MTPPLSAVVSVIVTVGTKQKCHKNYDQRYFNIKLPLEPDKGNERISDLTRITFHSIKIGVYFVVKVNSLTNSGEEQRLFESNISIALPKY